MKGEDILKIYNKVLIICVLLFVLIFDTGLSFAAQSVTVTKIEAVYAYGDDGNTIDGWNATSKYRSDIGTGAAFCGNAVLAGFDHMVGTTIHTWNNPLPVTDQNLRKTLYYGWKGVEQWSGFSLYGSYYAKQLNVPGGTHTVKSGAEACGICVTSMVLSDFHGKSPYSYDMAGKKPFEAFLRSKPNPPKRFKAYMLPAVASGSQDYFVWEYEPEGSLTLTKKASSNTALTSLCPENYSLAGAVYGVYDNAGKEVGRLTTNAEGRANTLTLAAGSYSVKEISAPKGYRLDTKIYPVAVTGGETATVSCSDEPLFDPLKLVIEKKAADGADKNLSLEGAEYTVKYYKELTDNVSGLTPFRTWVFKTDENGEFFVKDKYKVGGDELFKNDAGVPVGLIGTYTFEETKAPRGFAKTEGIISTQQVKADQTFQTVTVLKDVVDVEKPQTVEIELQKKDAETEKSEAQGKYGASLAGAQYDLFYFDPLKALDEKVATLTTDENGYAKITGLKPGKYTLKEIIASAGYLLDKTVIEIPARIKELNTATFTYTAQSKEKPITVEVVKTSYDERGVKVKLGGAALQLLNASGDVLEEWETAAGEEKTFKALPAGEYIIHEVKAPEGYFAMEDDIRFTVEEKEDVQRVEVFNEAIPVIKTEALFSSGVKESLPEENVTVFDEVKYEKLIPGKEYTAKAKLVLADDETKIIATGTKTFTPKSPSGSVKVPITFDARKLEGKTTVVFEDLYRRSKRVATHSEITDKKQSVHFPKIGTTAKDVTDKKDINDFITRLVDTTAYENLIPEKKYMIKGTVMNKETRKPFLDKEKKPVTIEKTFTANEKGTGSVDTEFTIDARLTIGKTLVIFEDVYDGDVLIARHHDLEDKGQTVKIPSPGTMKFHTSWKKGKEEGSPLTGDTGAVYLLAIATLLGGGGIACVRRIRKNKEQ